MAVVEGSRCRGYRALGRRRLATLLGATGPTPSPMDVAVALHQGFAPRMTAESLAQAVSSMRTTADLTAPGLAQTLRDPLVSAYATGLRRQAGPPPLTRGAVPMTLGEYTAMREGDSPLEFRQMAVLLWHRAARWADVKALRTGALWATAHGTWAVEAGQEKTSLLGVPGRYELYLPRREQDLLRPLLGAAPPPTRQVERGMMFPHADRKRFTRDLRRATGNGTLTTHSFRKGAVAQLLMGGVGLDAARLLTGHRTREGILPYAPRPDSHTISQIARASRALTG